MIHKKFKFVAVLFFCFVMTGLNAQQAIPASAWNASGSGGIVSYSIGQSFYSTISGVDASVAQGVQQPIEISVITAIKGSKDVLLECAVFPNPCTDILLLTCQNTDNRDLSYQLFDRKGQSLVNHNLISDETKINISKLAAASYFLKVIQHHKVIKIFKIIKQ